MKKKPMKPNTKTRKQLRKEQRQEKKIKRNKFLRNTLTNTQSNVSGVKQTKKGPGTLVAKEKEAAPEVSTESRLKSERSKQQKLKQQMEKNRRKQLLMANEDEDRNIKQLSKLLKLNRRKSKNLPKSFAVDGLDYLLEVCDSNNMKDAVKAEQALQDSDSEFEEDFSIVTGKKKDKAKNKSKESDKKVKGKTDVEQAAGSESESDNLDMGSDDEGLESGSDFGLGVDDGSSEDGEGDEDDVSAADSDLEESGSDGNEDEGDHDEDNSDSEDSADGNNSKGKKKVRFDIPLPKKRKAEAALEMNKKPKKDNELAEETKKNSAMISIGEEKKVRTIKKGSKPSMRQVESESETEPEDDDEEFVDFSGSDDEQGNEEFLKTQKGKEIKGQKNPDGTWEDIYGRARGKDGNVIQASTGKYVPPALRAKMAEDGDSKRKEQLVRLRRQLKGLVNRLAENNLFSISSQIDEMFMSNSRHDMNDLLLTLTLEALVSSVLTPERLVMEHVLLIAALHANVGTEVGAHFLQYMIEKFHELLKSSPPVQDKELDNIVLILSHMYNFKIFSASLMYEVLDVIAQEFNEKRVELLLLVLRSVGFSLRKDDPLALKNLILQLQSKAASASHTCASTRVKFMLDVLLVIKNNNMSKIPSYNADHIEHLKKLLRTLVRRGKYVTELKITIDDLLKADERGRWWIVGSAWSGVLPGETPNSDSSSNPAVNNSKETLATSSQSSKLMELARKQRMNTGIRKDIFCVLMTAEDYLDAFEKLLHLNLKTQQRQEIVHVLFDCCLQEKVFNPYYAHLAQKFCDFDRQYQMKFQYYLWDKLKELDNLSTSQLSNMARLLAHLFLEKSLAISALKVVSFADMDKACVRLVRQILLCVLLSNDALACEAVFRRVALSAQLRLFREGLRLFISHFVLRNSNSKALSDEKLSLLRQRAKLADAALATAEAKIAF